MDRDSVRNSNPEKICRLNASWIVIPIERFRACAVDTSTIAVVVFLGSVTKCSVHVRIGYHSDPSLFDTRVNTTQILISILVNRDLDGNHMLLTSPFRIVPTIPDVSRHLSQVSTSRNRACLEPKLRSSVTS